MNINNYFQIVVVPCCDYGLRFLCQTRVEIRSGKIVTKISYRLKLLFFLISVNLWLFSKTLRQMVLTVSAYFYIILEEMRT
jgi:hypothetical protein